MNTYTSISLETVNELTARVAHSGDDDQGLRVYIHIDGNQANLYTTEWVGNERMRELGGITPEQFATRLRELADTIDADVYRLRQEAAYPAPLFEGAVAV